MKRLLVAVVLALASCGAPPSVGAPAAPTPVAGDLSYVGSMAVPPEVAHWIGDTGHTIRFYRQRSTGHCFVYADIGHAGSFSQVTDDVCASLDRRIA